MNVLIYGGGAVGLGSASCLLGTGVRVFIIARENTVESLKTYGLNRSGIFGSALHRPAEINIAADAAVYRDEIMDFVLICTKSFDTETAAIELKKNGYDGNQRTLFVLFQNGWGNREILGTHLPLSRIFNARVITGFARPAPNNVQITVHAEDIHIGSFLKGNTLGVKPLCNAIRDGGVPCSATDTIVEDLWAKMLFNCPLNSLGAIFEASYGDLADDIHSRYLMDIIIEECFCTMNASGYSTHWESPEEYRNFFYQELIPPTRLHFPSTLQDIRSGKPTEIDSLNGAVVGLASQNHIAVPVNNAVYHMVKYKEDHPKPHV